MDPWVSEEVASVGVKTSAAKRTMPSQYPASHSPSVRASMEKETTKPNPPCLAFPESRTVCEL